MHQLYASVTRDEISLVGVCVCVCVHARACGMMPIL